MTASETMQFIAKLKLDRFLTDREMEECVQWMEFRLTKEPNPDKWHEFANEAIWLIQQWE